MRKLDYDSIVKKAFKNLNTDDLKLSSYENLKDFLFSMKKERPILKKHYSKEKEISELYALCTGLIACAIYFSNEDIDEKYKKDSLVYFSLLTNISNDILSVVNLIDNGFEFQANIIMRNLFELVYSFLVVLINKEIRIKYFDSAKFENEYTIWNKYFRMSKLNDELSKYEKEIFDKDFANELKDKRIEAYKRYSSYSHNDCLTCYIGCHSPDRLHYSEEDPHLFYNLWGAYNYDANKILNSLNYLMWMSFMYFRDIISNPDYFKKDNYISKENYIYWNNGFMILLMLEEEIHRISE